MGSLRYRSDRRRWQLDYVDAAGIRRRPFCAPGTRKAQAERQLREIEAGVRSGLAPLKRKASGLTLDEVITQWLEAGDRRWAPSTMKMREQMTRDHILPTLGRLRIGEIGTSEVQEWLNNLRLAGSTSGRMIHLLGSIFHWAVSQGLTDTNPTKGIAKPKSVVTIPRFLTREEYTAALEACKGDARDALVLGVASGVRAGELAALQWNDWQGHVLVVQRAYDQVSKKIRVPKGKKARRVPVSPEGLEVLERRKRKGPWILRGPEKTYKWWNRTCREVLGRAGVRGGPHLLRHTYASWWVQAGGSLMALQRALGHSKLEMTLIYAHLAPDSVEAEAQRVWGRLGTGASSISGSERHTS